jgi:hypothetical protein
VLVSPAGQEPDEVRAQRFAEYLGALSAQFKRERGWTVKMFFEQAGLSRNTFYRWRGANWTEGRPSLGAVRDFHTRLGLDPGRALEILGFAFTGAAEDSLAGAEPQVAEDIRLILRRLADPNEDPDDRTFIRRSLANLAGRSQSGSRRTRNRPAV